ncbi:MAG: hypothetical protein DRH37_10370 [Deltaproteobacteria bacterium]|nr:MAG: hypothetical protein DRH37_10370 [Deltaproteobacteria bacterium]
MPEDFLLCCKRVAKLSEAERKKRIWSEPVDKYHYVVICIDPKTGRRTKGEVKRYKKRQEE